MMEGCQCVIEAQEMGIILYWPTCDLFGSTRVCVMMNVCMCVCVVSADAMTDIQGSAIS